MGRLVGGVMLRVVLVGVACFLPWHTASSLAAEPNANDARDAAQLTLGRTLFTRMWRSGDQAARGDGLGPLFNERSCASCHKQGGLGGGGPNDNNVQIVNLVDLKADDPFYSTNELQRRFLFPTLEADKSSIVLHRFGAATPYGYWRRTREAMATSSGVNPLLMQRAIVGHLIEAEALPPPRTEAVTQGNLIASRRTIVQPSFVRLSLEERNTTALFGAGLIDAIPEAAILAIVETQPVGMRGRPARLPGGKIGRFGWKGQNESLLDFTENACAVELGLETSKRHEAAMPEFEQVVTTGTSRFVDSAAVDITDHEVAALTAFSASLPAPRQLLPQARLRAVRDGEALFTKIGCAVCHVRDVADARGVYSDFLLHRMGGYGSVYYGPTQTLDLASAVQVDEFRTPPLWGVADSAPYMHDGKAPSLHEAIMAHGVQADAAAREYRGLERPRQNELLAFLESLRAPSLK